MVPDCHPCRRFICHPCNRSVPGFFALARAERDDQGDFCGLIGDFFILEASDLGDEAHFCDLEPALRDDQGDFFTLIGDFFILIGAFCPLEAPDCVTKRAEQDAEVALQGEEPPDGVTFWPDRVEEPTDGVTF